MILVVSRASDTVAGDIHDLLAQRGHAVRRIDFRDFPSRDSLSFSLAADRPISRRLRSDGTELDLADVTAILWRRPSSPAAPAAFADPEVRRYVETATDEVVDSLFDDLDCFQVPARRCVLRQAYLKIPQLRLAAGLGFTLPDTLVGNDPEAFLDFWQRHAGRVITKTASVRAPSWLGPMGTGYARLVRPRDLVHYRDLQHCPLIAQAYVPKALEVRVTVVGAEVFAAGIHSQATRRTRVDWRRYDRRRTPHDRHHLPDAVAERCVGLTRALGLVYGSIDLILTPDGDYVFLEINPNGQYQWIEQLTGLPISERIVRLLVDHA